MVPARVKMKVFPLAVLSLFTLGGAAAGIAKIPAGKKQMIPLPVRTVEQKKENGKRD